MSVSGDHKFHLRVWWPDPPTKFMFSEPLGKLGEEKNFEIKFCLWDITYLKSQTMRIFLVRPFLSWCFNFGYRQKDQRNLLLWYALSDLHIYCELYVCVLKVHFWLSYISKYIQHQINEMTMLKAATLLKEGSLLQGASLVLPPSDRRGLSLRSEMIYKNRYV